MERTIIDVRGLSVIIGEKEILNNVSFEVFQEDYFIIFGLDDSGKTVLLSVLMGLVRKYVGEVKVFGQNIEYPNLYPKEHIRLVPDDIIMEKGIKVEEYFQFMRRGLIEYDKELEQRLCNKYNINYKEYLLDLTYQKNKLTAIIAAMCARPGLLILDEPYNFLEKSIMIDILNELNEINNKGTCVIVTAEKYEDLFGYGSRYLYLKDGTVKSTDKIFEKNACIKAVTISKKCDLSKYMHEIIYEDQNSITYKYFGNVDKLLNILLTSECKDCTIENLSFEEELEFFSEEEI